MMNRALLYCTVGWLNLHPTFFSIVFVLVRVFDVVDQGAGPCSLIRFSLADHLTPSIAHNRVLPRWLSVPSHLSLVAAQ